MKIIVCDYIVDTKNICYITPCNFMRTSLYGFEIEFLNHKQSITLYLGIKDWTDLDKSEHSKPMNEIQPQVDKMNEPIIQSVKILREKIYELWNANKNPLPNFKFENPEQ